MDFLVINGEPEKEFKRIARTLCNQYVLVSGKKEYRILEMEFYWHSEDHRDESTYQRKHADPKMGEWFFHYSGVDISLGDSKSGNYGGILIRSIQDTSDKQIYKGPMVCAMKLFSGTNAFKEITQTYLREFAFESLDPIPTSRIGLGKNAKTDGMHLRLYNFRIQPK